MADPLDPISLATLLNALTSIDQRLESIEHRLDRVENAFHRQGAFAVPPAEMQIAMNAASAIGGDGSASASPISMTPVVSLSSLPSQSSIPLPQTPQAAPLPLPPLPTMQQSQSQSQLLQHPQHPSSVSVMSHTSPHGLNPSAAYAPVTFPPLEPPPPGYQISSRASMQQELDQWTIPRGYSMRIAGAKVAGKKKVRWVCYRGGIARHHRPKVDDAVILAAKAEGRRKPTTDRASKKCGCLFKFEVVETERDSDFWVLHYPNDSHKVHNHGPSEQREDPRARKLPEYVLAEVDRWLTEGWQVGKIQEELKARGFLNVLNTDLYNRKRLLRKEMRQGAVG